MTTRPLTDHERQVLQHLLSVPFEGVEELRRQAWLAEVSGESGASLELTVPSSEPVSQRRDGPVPVSAHVYDETGRYLGELILWVAWGRLTSLEYAWVTDAPPTSLPPLAAIRMSLRG